MNQAVVAVPMGSGSDLPTMQASLDVPNQLDPSSQLKVPSAHRMPETKHARLQEKLRASP